MNIKLDIPEKFFEGEELCGYYVSPEMKKVWAVLLDLLAEFDRVCRKHNLKWWMAYGTLLGAVRHKGFIPWDDDVDVIMMRKDYKRLMEIADEFKKPYSLRLFNSADSLLLCAKLYNADTTMLNVPTLPMIKNGIKPDTLQSIYIDIFPLDNLPDDETETKNMCERLHALAWPRVSLLHDRLRNCTDNYAPAQERWKRPVKAAIHYILKPLNPFLGGLKAVLKRKRIEKMNQLKEAFDSLDYPEGERIANLSFIFGGAAINHRAWERSWFNETVYLPFEMLTLPAPVGYENILSKSYGDWHEFVISSASHGGFYDFEHPASYYLEEGHVPQYEKS